MRMPIRLEPPALPLTGRAHRRTLPPGRVDQSPVDAELIEELRRFARSERTSTAGQPGLDSEALDFHSRSESFAPPSFAAAEMLVPRTHGIVATGSGCGKLGDPKFLSTAFRLPEIVLYLLL